jgi:undecaprenyl-diphosphatase
METSILVRISARDRALMARYAIAPTARQASRVVWTAITHLGGTIPTVLAAGLPWFTCCAMQQASRLALLALVLSHLVVQLMKRTVGRGRPAKWDCVALVPEPDRFSFPSGHATAAMAVALSYGAVFPAWVLPLAVSAAVVGFSRVRLGVHYPSDVFVGQLIAAATTVGLVPFVLFKPL